MFRNNLIPHLWFLLVDAKEIAGWSRPSFAIPDDFLLDFILAERKDLPEGFIDAHG
ncbi:hypothetical protein AB0F96_29745 [Streptomyces sp. NPDC023998]|uniref:hypothetical protein n=1 Tax=Streptomyces sp. NPDC023998 TaxID=3154597 RepID=UPI0033DB7108